MNGAAFVTTWLPMGIFVACAAAAGMITNVLGKVLGWFGVVAGSTAVLATVATGVHISPRSSCPTCCACSGYSW